MEITDELVLKITEEVRRRLGLTAPDAAVRPGPAGPAPVRGRRRVLTEAEVRAACPLAGGPGQTLNLAPGDILTPLARDYVQSLKIDLSFSQGSP
jgi:hypothetical protein